MASLRAVTVFCGSSLGNDPRFEQIARALGKCLVDKQIDLIYGGGNNGLMGVISETVHGNGGKVTGFLPEFFISKFNCEVLDSNGKTEVVADMHTRKRKMLDMADAFIAMPGGYGTSEELLEMITWKYLGLHNKPIGVLNVAGYYDKFLEWILHGVNSGFIPNQNTSPYPEICVADNPEELLTKLTEALAKLNPQS